MAKLGNAAAAVKVAMLAAQGYLLKSAIESGKIRFMVVTQNGNVSIPVPTQTPR
jgi:hypothetical protein